MLQITNLSFSYSKSGHKLFHDFSLDLQPGNVYGLLGKNGAGKSTLIYLMTGLLTPASGQVTLDGIDVRRRLPQTLNSMFLVPEEFDLPHTTLSQFVKINAPFYPKTLTRIECNPYRNAATVARLALRFLRTRKFAGTVVENVKYIRGETF